jgi:hypothetical protein
MTIKEKLELLLKKGNEDLSNVEYMINAGTSNLFWNLNEKTFIRVLINDEYELRIKVEGL